MSSCIDCLVVKYVVKGMRFVIEIVCEKEVFCIELWLCCSVLVVVDDFMIVMCCVFVELCFQEFVDCVYWYQCSFLLFG